MKKILLTLAVAFALSAFSVEGYAQKKSIPYYSTEVMDEINATDAQRAAVKELSDKYNPLFKELRADRSLSKEEAEAKRVKLTSARASAYWKILNPEQTKYLKDKAKANK